MTKHEKLAMRVIKWKHPKNIEIESDIKKTSSFAFLVLGFAIRDFKKAIFLSIRGDK